MKLADYPKYTIIMRGYSYAEAEAILLATAGIEQEFAVEVTLNTPNALEHISKLNETFGSKIQIGAGTVRTLADVKEAITAGAKFLLGPHGFTTEMFQFAKSKGVLTVPSAMTPTEINEMFAAGADIVKIFPASVVTPTFFKDVQAPLGKLPLMAVGGITLENASTFFAKGAGYLGIGSGMFQVEDLKTLNVKNLTASLQQLLTVV
ncbi:bifunctional 4-hydroxy-2-oxoglutarate aldolase/2-dehydro-3-deoxy-phosphogluconate aldolase [Vagococcus salmoninarum]|uniref:bifunctional 4-hydroxy-2-oxoglutarate aldolase/2-dehydro-3-deoxy-phosphogluconate aldolase n=1 Tax=Vagococcus salmoninarum TaxID=2739 RepID=UPI00187E5F22|nr:bifunctional 4-hydroxy-2-oxoglutarate aldolase/2-dehydro-3-deoxy-phosphogluconate aldolase [Vagococcus salmoninarum]MBE9387821.1 bifunctional 4-hydroxy-2-oxoglutarate aldolase/2-dehydro-3-deoxy-phosphogluconate aldolase [Vagococcus salmoninarum]